MCGISGLMLTKGRVSASALRRNNAIMRHRGPDSASQWISEDGKLGFSQTRLAIVDPTARSDQPMFLDGGNIVLIFNGEIYNYVELRDELKAKYEFRTTSDTEVLGNAYREWGTGLLSRIEGMFAFAIHDKRKETLFIVRDFVGQKPLVYAAEREGFYFASEIPVLLSMKPKLKEEIDEAALRVYLTSNFSHIPQPFTAFKRIRKLRPAHYLVVKGGKVVEHRRYWRLEKRKLTPVKGEDRFVCDTIASMKPRDITYSSFLSGGNDSTMVCLGLRQENRERIDVYTMRVAEKDSDYERAMYVSGELRLRQTVVPFEPGRFLKSVEGQVAVLGEPYFHITSVYADQLLERVRERHKVIFTGAGGDESYYGYDNIQFLLLGIFLGLKRSLPGRLVEAVVPRRYRFAAVSGLRDIKRNYYLQNYRKLDGLLVARKDETETYFATINDDMFAQADLRRYIDLSYMMGLFVENSHSLTIQSDLVGMKNSVEVRCPFLEKRVIERGFSLPLSQKISPFRLREGKEIVRKALARRFSRRFAYARKVGFGVELEGYGPILRLHQEQIREKLVRLGKRPLFKSGAVARLSGRDDWLHQEFIFAMKLYALECWFERFVDR
jgi:asparagine synthase (glutamine-hydrolysing)